MWKRVRGIFLCSLLMILCISFFGFPASANASSNVLMIEGATFTELNNKLLDLVHNGGTDSSIQIVLNGEYGLDGDDSLIIPDGLTSCEGPDAIAIYGVNDAVIHGSILFKSSDGCVLKDLIFEAPIPGDYLALCSNEGAGPVFVEFCTFRNYSTAIFSTSNFIAPGRNNTFESCNIGVYMDLDQNIQGVYPDSWSGNRFINCGTSIYICQLHESFGPKDLKITDNTFAGSQYYDIVALEPGDYYFPGNTFLDADSNERDPLTRSAKGVIVSFKQTVESDFDFDASTGTITGYNGPNSVVTIPSAIGGTAVKALAPLGAQDRIRKIHIPASVTEIEIERNTFGLCWNLESIHVDEQNPTYTSYDGVLFSKDRKTLVRVPRGRTGEYVVPGWVERIGKDAFCDAFDVGPVVVLSGVTTIEKWAFNNTEMTEITLPKTLTTIDDEAFIYVEDLTDVYYTGSKSDWAKISIGSGNEALLNANIHYNAAEPAGNTETYTLKNASGKSVDVVFSKDWGTVSASGDVSADAPVLVASYDEDGRFLGLSVLTSPSAKAASEEASETVKILWTDAGSCKPLSKAEEVEIK